MTRRGALIGCGFFAENHLSAWAQLQGAEIVAVCDLDPVRLADVCERYEIAARFTDVRDMLASQRLDFVDIVTKVDAHRPLVEVCAPAVAVVICQKPFAATEQDAEAMVAVCRAHQTQLLIHENFRWQRAFTEMQRLVTSGAVGDLQFGRFSFRHNYNNYINQPYLAEIERFALMDVGLHLLDLARWFFGEVSHLSCCAQRLNAAVKGEDAFTIMLQHTSGAVSICDGSFSSTYHPQPFPNTAAVIEGDQGTLLLDRRLGLALHTRDAAQRYAVDPPPPPWGEKPWHAVQDSVLQFQAHAIAVMNGAERPQPSGADNLKTLRLALAAYDAAEQGGAIDLACWRERAR